MPRPEGSGYKPEPCCVELAGGSPAVSAGAPRSRPQVRGEIPSPERSVESPRGNPEFYKAQALRLSTFGKPRVISSGEEFPRHIGLPRGCLEEVVNLLKAHEIEVEVKDERFAGMRLDVAFQGELSVCLGQAATQRAVT